jgi:hypothetical protein
MDESTKFKEALNNYYSLKRDYDEAFNRVMISLRGNKQMTPSQKRERLKKRCVNCDYMGQEGTIFKIEVKHNSDPLETHRILIATCGNPSKAQKCNLNIQLDVGRFCLLPRIVEDLTEKFNLTLTNNIIEDNKFNFGYMSKEEGLANLPLLESAAETAKKDLGEYSEELRKIEMNEELENEIKTEEKLMQTFLEEFKQRMKIYYQDANRDKAQLKELMREYKIEYFDFLTCIH